MAITEAQRRYRGSAKHKQTLAAYRERNRDRIKENARRYRERNPEAVRASNAKVVESLRKNAPERLLYYAAKRSTKAEGLPFDITLDDVEIPERCPVFGVPFVRLDKKWAASLDKIDPSLGYVKGNVQVISMLANTMKNSATKEELTAFAMWVMGAAI